jgi:DegV family protein with EDD domain
MSRKVIITADSTCDLSPELIEKYQVKIIPLVVGLDGTDYLDGVDITPDDIYKTYDEKKILPKTSANTIVTYQEIFQKYVDDGFDVFHVALSSKISSTCNNAKLASEEFQNVKVLDSLALSTGCALLIIKAAHLADKGYSAQEIYDVMVEKTSKVSTSFVLDTLEYMYKGGRCSSVAALGANLLKLKPEIDMHEGSLGVGKKYRGALSVVLPQYVKNQLEGRDDLDLNRIFITHTQMPDPALVDLVRKEIKKYANFKDIYETTAGSTITSHCGKGCLGILFMTK